jgi:hypothetical protein
MGNTQGMQVWHDLEGIPEGESGVELQTIRRLGETTRCFNSLYHGGQQVQSQSWHTWFFYNTTVHFLLLFYASPVAGRSTTAA